MQDYLKQWANRGPVTLLQLLPARLWGRSALSAGLPVQLGARLPGAPNPQLHLQELPIWEEGRPDRGLKLPIITLESVSLKPWARMLAGCGDSWATGVWFDEDWQTFQHQAESPAPALSPAQQVKRFNTTASLLARRLAGLMAMVPVSLPIIYLIQATLLPESSQLQVAEVFMSGLIRRLDDAPAAARDYDFVAGVRELLIDAVPLPAAEAVLDRVSQYIGEKAGKAIYSFTALLMLEKELSATEGPELLKFARIAKQALRRLGGEYAQLVESIENTPQLQPATADARHGVPGFPPLKVLEFETARIEPVQQTLPPLQTQRLKIATLTVEAGLDTFEFEGATLERHQTEGQTEWVIQRWRRQAEQFLEPLSDEIFLELVAIPGGEFLMGSPEAESKRDEEESPQHPVTVQPFFISKYPITQAQWRTVAALPIKCQLYWRVATIRLAGQPLEISPIKRYRVGMRAIIVATTMIDRRNGCANNAPTIVSCSSGIGLRRATFIGALSGRALTVAVGVNIDNEGMMDKTINCRNRHHVIGENSIPLAKGLIGSNE